MPHRTIQDQRFMNYTGNYVAPLKAAILYDSDENEVGTTDNPITISAPITSFDTAIHAVVVVAANTVVLVANQSRRYALFVNDSANPIYLALNSAAAANFGIRLNANGGSYTIDLTNLFVGEVRASGAGQLLVTEMP